MKKNLLFIHLESLNMVNYKMNRDLFPTLKEVEKHCMVFEQYYSTATSTLMVIGDLLYGGMNLYEECETLDYIPKEYCYSSSLLDDLKAQGYNTGVYTYLNGLDQESAKARHLVGFQNQMVLASDYSEYINTLEREMNRQPFALMACNYVSNMGLNHYIDINDYSINTDYWEAGYRCMDRSCLDIMQLLKSKNLVENTIVVMYGDHGDDYWGHGFHNGLTHAIEPNSLLIHTPLFIWDGGDREQPKYDLRLVQTSDLRRIIENLLIEKSIDELLSRKYAISRNAYAAQPVREESFNKTYSVTDGRYLLMVSSRGVEMYDNKMDPACQNNVLRFFNYENGVLKEKRDDLKELKYHFFSYWTPREQRILRQKFYELKKVLYNETLQLYMAGRRNEAHMLKEMCFDKIA